MDTRLPTYFLSHGGGPWPYMKHELGTVFDKLEKSIVDILAQISTPPRAVLVISGHWENPQFTVSSNPKPPMVYDYYGFPEYTYKVKYEAPGSPQLAAQVKRLLEGGGLECRMDAERGFDHGTFSIMVPLFPQAQIPVVQLSLQQGYSPSEHMEAGRLLAPLRDEGVLILGSGLSYHNLRRLDRSGASPSREFDGWLSDTLTHVSPTARRERLVGWNQAPSARLAHPSEDHLLPLMVAVGAAEEEAGHRIYHEDDLWGSISVSSFRFGKALFSGT